MSVKGKTMAVAKAKPDKMNNINDGRLALKKGSLVLIENMKSSSVRVLPINQLV